MTYAALALLALAWFALSPTSLGATPIRNGSYPNHKTAEADDALSSLTTGAKDTAMEFDALDSLTSGSDNALASWTWRRTGRLNTSREFHTATLLQNGMVLVAGGQVGNDNALASAELGHRQR